MNIKVDQVKVALRVVTYKALDKNDTLNSLANRVTSGAVNRDKLAERILSDVIKMAPGIMASSKMLGERTPEIISQASNLFFNNTRAQTEQGIASLIGLLAASKGQGEFAQKLAGILATQILPSDQLQDHTLERILSELGKQKGGESILKLAVDNAVAGFTGEKMISSTVMSILKRAVLDRTEYKENNSWTHKVAAWELHKALLPEKGTTGFDKHQLPPAPEGWQTLKTTAATTATVVSTAAEVLTGHTISNMMAGTWNLLDDLAPPAAKPAKDAFHDAWSSDFAMREDMPLQTFAALVIKANTLGRQSTLTQYIDALPEKARVHFTQQRSQIDSLYQRWPGAEIKVAPTWSGGLASVSANQSRSHSVNASILESVKKQSQSVIGEPEKVGNHMVDKDFLTEFRSGMNLTLNDSQRGYADRVTGIGNQLLSGVKGYLGWQDSLNATQQQQIEQLSQMVEGDPLRLPALTRYLNSSYLLKENPLSGFPQSGADVICADNIWMKLGKPEVSFVVNRDDENNITVETQLKWPVLMSGKSPETLKPAPEKTGSITVSTQAQFLQKGVVVSNLATAGIRVDLQEVLLFQRPPPEKTNQPPSTTVERDASGHVIID